MIIKLRFLAAFALMFFLPLAAAKDSKPGGVSGRIVAQTPDGKEVPGEKVKVYLMLSGGGKYETKENCVNSKCTKRYFVDGKELDMTGIRTNEEFQQALKRPAAFFSEESSRQLDKWLADPERSHKLTEEMLADTYSSKEHQKADCLELLGAYGRSLSTTEKWVSDTHKTDQFFVTETSQDGKFVFGSVPEGIYYLVAYGSAGERRAVWHVEFTVKSGKQFPLDPPKELRGCSP